MLYLLLGVFLFLINSGGHTYFSFFSIFHLFASASSIPFFCFSLKFLYILSFFRMAPLWFEDEGRAGDNARGGDRSCCLRDPPPFPIVEYIEQYSDRLEGKLFSAMLLAGGVGVTSHVCTGRTHDTSTGAWTKRWRHCGGRGATD